jgi:hypothetical protein
LFEVYGYTPERRDAFFKRDLRRVNRAVMSLNLRDVLRFNQADLLMRPRWHVGGVYRRAELKFKLIAGHVTDLTIDMKLEFA